MEMSYEIDEEKRLVISTWRGRHDPLTVQNYVQSLLADEALTQGLNYISDQRELETKPSKVSIELGVVFLEMLLSKIGPYKYAIVSQTADTYDLEYMHSHMQHIPDISVAEFANMEDAIDWIADEG